MGYNHKNEHHRNILENKSIQSVVKFLNLKWQELACHVLTGVHQCATFIFPYYHITLHYIRADSVYNEKSTAHMELAFSLRSVLFLPTRRSQQGRTAYTLYLNNVSMSMFRSSFLIHF